MYTTMQPTSNRKKLFSALLIAFLALAGSSCKKSNTSTSDAVTTDDAADAITAAVTPETAGMVAQTQTTVVIINGNDLGCGEERDTAFSGANAAGASITYAYSFSSNRLLTCNNGVPSQFQYNFSGKTSYDAPKISSSDSSKAQFTVSGLQPSASQYVFNASYIRNGSETSKVRNKTGFTSTITITSTNLTIDKISQQILSGTAAVSISGATTTGRSFSYSGSITFLGNKQATLVLGNGSTYNILWP